MATLRSLRLLLVALVVVVAPQPGHADEVDKLAISDDFLALPRTAVYVSDVPQPPNPQGKLQIAPNLGRIMTQELLAALERVLPAAAVSHLPAAIPPEGLVVDCRFSRLVPGSRAKRFWLGYGAGKSILEVSGDVRDLSSARVVARFVHARLSWCCGFGSNDHEITTNLVNAANDIAAVVAGKFHAEQRHEPLPRAQEIQPTVTVLPGADDRAILVIESTAEHSEVEVDGRFVGTTPMELNLVPGTYQIAVRKVGFEAWTRDVHLLPGSKQKVHADLGRSE